jgi:PAP2 superfamily
MSATAVAAQTVVLRWDSIEIAESRTAKVPAPAIARSLAVLHTCMYDAWAAYDDRAVGTQLAGALRRPPSERTEANKEKAISYAAYRALSDLFPADINTVYKPLMKELGYDPHDNSTDIETPQGIGNVACAAVLEYRHHDRSNQLGDLAPGAYSDWTHFRAVNMPGSVPVSLPSTHPIDANHWQPLMYVNASGESVTQMFIGAHWSEVTPFALTKGDEFRASAQFAGPALYGSKEYEDQARELIDLSASLTDRQKMIAEYWSDGPNTAQPPGHWIELAEFVSARDHHTLDEDVKMFFALSNAMFDTGIAAWDMKRTYDSIRPITAIPLLFNGKKIRAWGGPGRGTVEIEGSQWLPYQPATFPTPPFPDYVSGHSAYSAAAAFILKLWTGSDRFGYSVILPAGSSKIEPGITPALPVTLSYATFTDAAEEAGMSRRYGGLHFRRADLDGRVLGRLVAEKAWSRAQAYFNGTATPVSISVAQTR